MKLPDKAGLFCYCTLLIIEVALIECIKEPIGQCLHILSFISAGRCLFNLHWILLGIFYNHS